MRRYRAVQRQRAREGPAGPVGEDHAGCGEGYVRHQHLCQGCGKPFTHTHLILAAGSSKGDREIRYDLRCPGCFTGLGTAPRSLEARPEPAVGGTSAHPPDVGESLQLSAPATTTSDVAVDATSPAMDPARPPAEAQPQPEPDDQGLEPKAAPATSKGLRSYLREQASFLPRNEIVTKTMLRKGRNWLSDHGVDAEDWEEELAEAVAAAFHLSPVEWATIRTLSSDRGAREAQQGTDLALRRPVDLGRPWWYPLVGASLCYAGVGAGLAVINRYVPLGNRGTIVAASLSAAALVGAGLSKLVPGRIAAWPAQNPRK